MHPDTPSALSQPRPGRLDLICGGARSGKSRFAVDTALKVGPSRLFIATARAWDPEMQERIRLHQEERRQEFQTLDAPFALHHQLEQQTSFDVIIIDCLTLWISNLLLLDRSEAAIREDVQLGLEAARAKASRVLLVSNEVGFGIVPDNALARRFRDLNGRVQQDIAAVAAEVHLVAMGVVLPLRALSRLAAESSHA